MFRIFCDVGFPKVFVCDLAFSSILAFGIYERHICEYTPVAILLQALMCPPFFYS